MKPTYSAALGAAFSLALFAVACMGGSDEGDKPPAGKDGAEGAFVINVVPPTSFSSGVTTVLGNVFDGPVATVTSYKDEKKAGDCTLKVSKNLQCDPKCGSGSICVDVNKCQVEPDAVGVGAVTLTGFKAAAGGAAAITMNPTSASILSYQLPAEPRLAFPPGTEGDLVTLAAAGSAAVAPFSVSTKAIAPLTAPADSLVLADGQPLLLTWAPAAAAAGSKMHVEVNITNHGAHKGKIACETADDGSLEVAASLVDGLKALGVSGFPSVDLVRRSQGTSAQVDVDLVIESKFTLDLSIPGIISCTVNEDCPSGKTCSDATKVCQ